MLHWKTTKLHDLVWTTENLKSYEGLSSVKTSRSEKLRPAQRKQELLPGKRRKAPDQGWIVLGASAATALAFYLNEPSLRPCLTPYPLTRTYPEPHWKVSFPDQPHPSLVLRDLLGAGAAQCTQCPQCPAPVCRSCPKVNPCCSQHLGAPHLLMQYPFCSSLAWWILVKDQ